MSKEATAEVQTASLEAPGAIASIEVENYPGQIEWYRLADSKGRLYRIGLIELTDLAGQRFLGGANSDYRLAILLDVNGVGQAYPFRMGGNHGGEYLSPEYVHEKLGKALYFKKDVLTFTHALARLLNRPTVNNHSEEEAAG
jgi:hypothetical protein